MGFKPVPVLQLLMILPSALVSGLALRHLKRPLSAAAPSTFGDLGSNIDPSILSTLTEKGGFTSPTPGQAAVWSWFHSRSSTSPPPPPPSSSTSTSTSTSKWRPRQFASPRTLILGAETGSGKTLSYLLPIINQIVVDNVHPPARYPSALIIVPNEVLAYQVERMAKQGVIPDIDENGVSPLIEVFPSGITELADFRPWRPSPPPTTDITMFPIPPPPPSPHIVISTPSRLASLSSSVKTSIPLFTSFSTIVLDEVDLLLTGSNLPHTKRIFQALRAVGKLDEDLRGTSSMPKVICTGATIPTVGVKFSPRGMLLKEFPEAEWVEIAGFHNGEHGGLNVTSSVTIDSENIVWTSVTDDNDRFQKLVALLKDTKTKTIVYVNTANNANMLCEALEQQGGVSNLRPYHAKLSKDLRMRNLIDFTNYNEDEDDEEQSCRTLISTDLSARGLDLPKVHRVIEFEMALDVVSHLHRIGRCGRLAPGTGRNDGEAVVFFDENGKDGDLVRVIREGGFVVGEDGEVDGENQEKNKDVGRAFSRRRGFRKGLKKKKAKAALEEFRS